MIPMRVFHRRLTSLAVLATLLLAAACGDDPAGPIPGAGDPENISRVTITLTPVGGGTAVTSVRVDPDGSTLPLPVGAAQGVLALTKGRTYNGTIALLNDLSSSNIINITDEVKEEANFHRFFYTFSCAGVNVPVSSLDVDTQTPPAPLGVTFQVVVDAGAASTSSCTLHVELHHFEQNKGDGTGSTFDTDLSLDFPVTVQ
jgi:hypothetical protein